MCKRYNNKRHQTEDPQTDNYQIDQGENEWVKKLVKKKLQYQVRHV